MMCRNATHGTTVNQNYSKRWLRIAFVLSVITICYNIAEGIVSVIFGATNDTLALLGFGIDSFVEVISGIGIAHMIYRMRKANISENDAFEQRALRITGTSFYILAGGLLLGIFLSTIYHKTPETTIAGIIVASISIFSMYFLMRYKLKAGKKLKSDAIISDANCTLTCLYLSIILLISSILYEWLHISYIDLAGSLGIAWFAFSDGRESFEKARQKKLNCSCGGDCHLS
jgi:divalent metal cation (Fe/Co/Zn/Cd) transporter